MKDIESTVFQVTVYVDRARIHRKAKVTLEPGDQRLELVGLPLNLDPDSVRVKASGTARARIRGVDLERRFFKDVPPGKAKELTEEIQTLRDRDRSLADTGQTLEAQLKHLDGVAENTKTYAVSLARGQATPESHAGLIDFFTSRRLAAQEKLRQNAIERRDLGLQIKKLEEELNLLQHARPRQRFSAVVDTSVDNAGDLEVELIYNMPGIHWIPLYDIRLLEEEMEVQYLAQVQQSTGEDWQDITLMLSTVPPSTGIEIPELQPWYVAPYYPPPPAPQARAKRDFKKKAEKEVMYAAAAPMGAGLDDFADDLEVAEEAEPVVEEAIFENARVAQSGASVTYTVPGKVDIPGDGTRHKTVIAGLKFTPRIDFVSAPAKECRAYRRVKAENDSELMLLPGPAQVFEGEDFIGKTALKMVAPGEEIKVYAGTDDRIRIERKLVQRDTDKKLLADRRRITYVYEIKLENHTGKEQTVWVRDQIPVSRHESIKVKLEETEPRVKEKDGLNRLEWELVLADKGKRTLSYEYSLEYPRDMTVHGLA